MPLYALFRQLLDDILRALASGISVPRHLAIAYRIRAHRIVPEIAQEGAHQDQEKNQTGSHTARFTHTMAHCTSRPYVRTARQGVCLSFVLISTPHASMIFPGPGKNACGFVV